MRDAKSSITTNITLELFPGSLASSQSSRSFRRRSSVILFMPAHLAILVGRSSENTRFGIRPITEGRPGESSLAVSFPSKRLLEDNAFSF